MSVVLEIIVWLIIETGLGFLFYSTGCLILKIFTFGQFKAELKDFASFKGSKSKKVYVMCLLGISFYVLLIVLMAYLNH